jgi:hypothetical protein
MKRVVCAGVAGLVLAMAGTAQAADPHCMWKNLPQETKETFLASPPSKDSADNPFKRYFTETQLAGAAMACGAASPDQVAKSDMLALIGIMERSHAERWLSEHEHVSPERLAAAWDAVSADDKAALDREFRKGNPMAASATFDALQSRAGLPAQLGDTSRTAVEWYALARAIEATKGTFVPEV